jgi:hypothetical protein
MLNLDHFENIIFNDETFTVTLYKARGGTKVIPFDANEAHHYFELKNMLLSGGSECQHD